MKKTLSLLLSLIVLVTSLVVPVFAIPDADDLELMNAQASRHSESYTDDYGHETYISVWFTDKYTYKGSTYEESSKNGDRQEGVAGSEFTHGCIKKVANDTGVEDFIISDCDSAFVVIDKYIYYYSYVFEYDKRVGEWDYAGVDYVRTDLDGNNREILYHSSYTPYGSGVGGPPAFFVTDDCLYVSKYTIEQVDFDSKQVKTIYDGRDTILDGNIWLDVILVDNETVYFSAYDNGTATLQNAFFKYNPKNGLTPIFYVQEVRDESSGQWVESGDGFLTFKCKSDFYTFFAGRDGKERTRSEDYSGVALKLTDNNPFSNSGIAFLDENSGDNWFYDFKTEKLKKYVGDKGEVSVDFKIDGIKGSTTVSFNSVWFSQDSLTYQHNISKMSSQLVMLGYASESTLKQVLFDLGFQEDCVAVYRNTSRNEVNCFVAQKEIHINNKTYNLVITGLIGSFYHQWYSNFDPYGRDRNENGLKVYADDKEKTRYHLGFADAKEFAYSKLVEFMESHNNGNETKLLIAGHSRGAAAANLLGAKIIKSQSVGTVSVKKENIFTYTFATPNNAILTDSEKNDKDFKRIFNIVNPEDFVTEVLPVAWKYSRYGTTYTLPSKSNTNMITYSAYKKNMQTEFSKLCIGSEYQPYRLGTYAVDKVVKAMTVYVDGLDDFYNKKFLMCFDRICPMDYFKTVLCPIVVSPKKMTKINRKTISGWHF